MFNLLWLLIIPPFPRILQPNPRPARQNPGQRQRSPWAAVLLFAVLVFTSFFVIGLWDTQESALHVVTAADNALHFEPATISHFAGSWRGWWNSDTPPRFDTLFLTLDHSGTGTVEAPGHYPPSPCTATVLHSTLVVVIFRNDSLRQSIFLHLENQELVESMGTIIMILWSLLLQNWVV